MLGLTFLFALGDYRVLASVTTLPFQDAVKQAKTRHRARAGRSRTTSTRPRASGTTKFDEGKALVGGTERPGHVAAVPQP